MRNALPTYDHQTVKSAPAPDQFQRIQADPAAFGGLEGQALARAGSQVAQAGSQLTEAAIAVDERKKADEILQRTGLAQKAVNEKLHGSVDANGNFVPGLLSKVGTEAFDGTKNLIESIPALKAEATKGITDPRQIEIINRKIDTLAQSAQGPLASHEAQQRTAVTTASSNTAVSSAADNIVLNWGDQSAHDVGRNTIVGAITSAMHGQPQAVIDEKINDTMSKVYSSVVQRTIINGDPLKASQIYEDLKKQGKITAPDQIQLDTKLKPLMQALETETTVQRIVTGTGTPAASVQGAIDEVRRVTNTAVEQAAASPVPGAAPVTVAGFGNLVRATARTENATGDGTAVSSKGAVGVMQIMPATAKMVSAQIGDGRLANMSETEISAFLRKPENHALASTYGTIYLTSMLGRYNGQVAPALIAYNAGPGVADEWVKTGDWSKVPSETRAYVPQVIAKMKQLDGSVGPYGDGRGGQAVAPNMPSLPQPGIRLQRSQIDTLPNAYYKAADVLPPNLDGGADARFMTMANELGRRFEQMTGIKVPINIDHDTGSTEGHRRGVRAADDNPGVKRSQHLEGKAGDFQIQNLSDEQKLQFVQLAREIGFTGYGAYKQDAGGHLHLDIGAPRSWSGSSGMPDWAKSVNWATSTRGGGSSEYAGPTPGGVQLPVPVNMQQPQQGDAAWLRAYAAHMATIPAIQPLPYDVNAAPPGATASSPGGAATAIVPAQGGVIQPEVPHDQYTVRLGARNYAEWRRQAQEAANGDPLQAKANLALVETKIQELEKQRKEVSADAYADGLRHVMSGKDLMTFDPNKIALMEGASPGLLKNLYEVQESMRKRAENMPDDPAAIAAWAEMSDAERAGVSAEQLRDLASRVKPATLNTMLKERGEVIRKSKDPERFDESPWIRRIQDATLDGLKGVGDAENKSLEAAQLKGMFVRAFQEEIRAETALLKPGQLLDHDKVQAIADRLAKPIAGSGGWMGRDKYMFEAGSAQENQRRYANQEPYVGIEKGNLNTATSWTDIPPTVEPVLNQAMKAFHRTSEFPAKDTLVPLFNEIQTARNGRVVEPTSSIGIQFAQAYRAKFKDNPLQLAQLNKDYAAFLTAPPDQYGLPGIAAGKFAGPAPDVVAPWDPEARKAPPLTPEQQDLTNQLNPAAAINGPMPGYSGAQLPGSVPTIPQAQPVPEAVVPRLDGSQAVMGGPAATFGNNVPAAPTRPEGAPTLLERIKEATPRNPIKGIIKTK